VKTGKRAKNDPSTGRELVEVCRNLVARMQLAGRGSQDGKERPWIGCTSVGQPAVRPDTVSRRRSPLIVEDCHKAPSTVAHGNVREVVPESRRCSRDNSERRRREGGWWWCDGVGVEVEVGGR
jgi:hypothetical protein